MTKIFHTPELHKEIWKDIIGFEGLYQISNYGRVKSLDRVIIRKSRWGGYDSALYLGRILKKAFYKNGYAFVSLSSPIKIKQIMIHRLVAIHFINNPQNKNEVNHKDGLKANNQVDNLEWVTASENMKHSFAIGLNKQRFIGYTDGKHPNCKQIYDTKTKKIYQDIKSASDDYGLTYSYLASMLNGNKVNKTSLNYL